MVDVLRREVQNGRNNGRGHIYNMKKWMCLNCGYVYDQEKGDPEGNIPPGTAWEDVPETWACPDCGAPKDNFDMVEI
jgi:rubredoxin